MQLLPNVDIGNLSFCCRSQVTRILNKKKIHIFYMNKLSELRVYLDKSDRLEDFQVGKKTLTINWRAKKDGRNYSSYRISSSC